MNTDQRAAIERLRNFVSGVVRTYENERYHHDMCVVRDLYLAEHTADDAEAVTAEWLRSVGFAYIPDKEFTDAWGNPQILAYFQRTEVITVGDEGPAVNVKTRGDVRRLCAALGIELKESA